MKNNPAPGLDQDSHDSLFDLASIEVGKLISSFDSSLKGLSSRQAESQLNHFGKNQIEQESKKHVVVEFLNNFANPLVIILMVVAVISFVMGELVDGIIVSAMVLMSVTLNFIQEYKASHAAAKLKKQLAHQCTVIRTGREIDIDSSLLVPGDILVLNAGDLIPADARVIEARDCFVNQGSLTGESLPVEKHAGEVSSKTLTELTNIVFAGTSVITGTAHALVVKTGRSTQFGQIAAKLATTDADNDFALGVNQFGRLIFKIIVIFVIFIFAANALLKGNLIQAFSFAIAVAVGLTPEFLPMIMSVTMGKGAVAMSKKGVIVKKLTAIPSFGSMDILCTDKTGTLTEDNIQLVKYVDLFGRDNDQVLLYSYLNSYFETGITNPLDQAVLKFKKLDVKGYQKIDEIPFDFHRRRMSVVVKKQTGEILITKGAPEEIFTCCNRYLKDDGYHELNPEIKQEYLKVYNDLSRDGYRVLAVATNAIDKPHHPYTIKDETNLALVGFIAFLDPPKKDALEALNELEAMGIEVKVITGDNELVAEKICTEVGVNVKGIMVSSELKSLSAEELKAKVETTTIFARFSPEDKNKIIEVLRQNGHCVGYMGDGINDSLSLKTADVGISVANAVDVARESADFILTQKNLHLLKDGVLEGRKTFGNTLKYVMMGLSSNFGNMFSVLGAVIFLPFLPMLPIQILLNNFLYDFAQISIPIDHVDHDWLLKPQRWSMSFIRRFMLTLGPVSSIFDFISFGLLYYFFKNTPTAFQTGWFMESLATQTLVVHIIRTRKIPFIQSRAHWLIRLTTISMVAVGWIIPYTVIGKYFGLVALPLPILLMLIVVVAVYLILAEITKQIFYRFLAPST